MRELPSERQPFLQAGGDEIQDGLAPLAGAHIQEGCTRGVPVLHALLAGEPKIKVIVRQEDAADRRGKLAGSCCLSQRILGAV